jgi:hypothetical protein
LHQEGSGTGHGHRWWKLRSVLGLLSKSIHMTSATIELYKALVSAGVDEDEPDKLQKTSSPKTTPSTLRPGPMQLSCGLNCRDLKCASTALWLCRRSPSSVRSLGSYNCSKAANRRSENGSTKPLNPLCVANQILCDTWRLPSPSIPYFRKKSVQSDALSACPQFDRPTDLAGTH